MTTKRKIIILGIVLVIIGSGVGVYFLLRNDMTSPNLSLQEAKGRKEVSESNKEETQSPTDEAVGTLEKPDKEVTGEERKKVIANLKIAFDYLKSLKPTDTPKPSGYYHIQPNEIGLLNQVNAPIAEGYTYSEEDIKVFLSDNSETVLQFVVTLKMKDKEDVAIAGNYIINTEQIQFVNIKGNGDGYAYE